MRKSQLRSMLLWNLLFSAAAIWWMLSSVAGGTGNLPGQNDANGKQPWHGMGAGESSGAAYADNLSQSSIYGGALPEERLTFQTDSRIPGFAFPLPSGVEAEDLFMESRCGRQDFLIVLPGSCGDFFKNSIITGNGNKVNEVYLSGQEEFTRLRLVLDDVYEYAYTVENGMVVLTFEAPARFYDRIVVVDVERSTGGETGMVMEVAEQVQSRLEKEGIRVYRSLSTEMSAEERAEFADRLGADLLIGIRQSGPEAVEESETVALRILYNDTYFIPYFGNGQLVSLLESHVSGETGQSVVGVLPVARPEDPLLQYVRIPAAVMELGAGEKAPAMDETYREKLVAGIAGAVLEACDQTDRAQEIYYER